MKSKHKTQTIAERILASRRVAMHSTAMSIAVFITALFVGGILSSILVPFIPFNFGNISLQPFLNYTVNIVGFLATGLLTFPVLIYMNRRFGTSEG